MKINKFLKVCLQNFSVERKNVMFIRPQSEYDLNYYISTFRNIRQFQEESDNDLIVIIQDIEQLNPSKNQMLIEKSYNALSWSLACGLDTKKATIFRQSDIPMHSEFLWILSSLTPMHYLKSILTEQGEMNKTLLDIQKPLLRISQLLLYHTQKTIGDQLHQNLVNRANEIGDNINYIFGLNFFRKISCNNTLPKPLKNLQKNYMDMKLSRLNEKGVLHISDDTKLLKYKFKKATTDYIFDDVFYCESRREINNLIQIFSIFTGIEFQECFKEFNKKNLFDLKIKCFQVVNKELASLREQQKLLLENKDQLENIFQEGREQILETSQQNLKEIRRQLFLYHNQQMQKILNIIIFIFCINCSIKTKFRQSLVKGEWYVQNSPQFLGFSFDKKIIIAFENEDIVIKLFKNKNVYIIKGKSHSDKPGRYDVKLDFLDYYKYFTFDLRFMKIDHKNHILIGSKNKYIFDIFELKQGWILSKEEQMDKEEFKIQSEYLQDKLGIKQLEQVTEL